MISEPKGMKWEAKWVSACFMSKVDEAVMAPYFRKTFSICKPVGSAVMYIAGLGYFKASVNGMAVSDEVLAQPYTKYDSTILYSSYDVKQLIREGNNVIGVILGNGWYNCFTKDVWNSREATWRSLPKLIVQIHITYEDGSKETIISDSSWRSSDGPIVFNGIRNGETYDARLEKKNWDTPEYDDKGWGRAVIARSPGGILKPFNAQPIRITRSFMPVNSWETPEGAWIFDMGVNMAGFCRIGFTGPAGTEATIRYSEILDKDGVHINQGSISGFVRSGDFQTDRYIKGSDSVEYWHPDFVYHGFQYAEITGCTEKPEVEALMINTDMERHGWFECSDETLNALYKASNQSIISNFHGLPTDDPHREKNAWTGDISLSAEQILFNFDSAPMLRKWLGDIRDSQKPDGSIPCVVPSTGWGYNWGNGPDWSSALTLIPWYIYIFSGDTEVLEENYDAICRHFAFMDSMAEDGIVSYGIGDWCPPFEGRALMISMSSFKCPVEVTDTAYYYNTAKTIEKIATVLGNNEDSRLYSDKAEKIKKDFRRHFIDEKTGDVLGDCQTSIACAIYQGLMDDSEKPALLRKLMAMIEENDFHQDTGILGNKYLHNTLGEHGLMDLSLRMINNPTYPSFRNWIDRGATTLWECWNGEGSRNHHMFSDFIAVFFRYLAGISPDEEKAGFKVIDMVPQVKCGLEWVRASHESVHGRISVAWRRGNGETVFDIEIPKGCEARFKVPGVYGSERKLMPGRHGFTVKE
ncbi:MAG TPA: family 78 glycoside hydrolase catalytic domain [Clostridia bacterium]|nr:family 78 glycoside hydrolase catalytic domain [Clostridia bacterium]HPQ46662.1 family 78 glycoside hydrolase catalytic domain [Clostridia bacterium]